MSFAGEKGELCRTALNRKCCTQAEAYGVLLYCNTFFRAGDPHHHGERGICPAAAPILFRKAFPPLL